jgi:hypothetical protein
MVELDSVFSKSDNHDVTAQLRNMQQTLDHEVIRLK